MSMNKIELYLGDCLEIMQRFPDKSVDMILCDLPYGTTTCSWDIIIPFDRLWEQYHRIVRTPNSPIVLFGVMPFICEMWASNKKEYRHEWIWEKSRSGSAITAKHCPVKIHEHILVFSKESPNYFPIMQQGKPYFRQSTKSDHNDHNFGILGNVVTENNGTRYPKTILSFKQNWSKQQQLHPTQKPVELCEYLIKTYSKENDVVLDNCMGSGTTGVACIKTNRNFIGVEKEQKYFEIAQKRIKEIEGAYKLWQ